MLPQVKIIIIIAFITIFVNNIMVFVCYLQGVISSFIMKYIRNLNYDIFLLETWRKACSILTSNLKLKLLLNNFRFQL